MSKSVTVKAPAKLIISGEHSVVHGAPAIAMALDLYTSTTVTSHSKTDILFEMLGFNHQSSHPIDSLRKIKHSIQAEYNKFLSNEISIRRVLKKPFELLQYTTSNLLDKLNPQNRSGVKINTASDIPTGCGLGSSAAAIVSTNHAIAKFFKLDISKAQAHDLALEAENLQHGKSSGIDIHISMHGGCHYYQASQFQQRALPKFPYTLVNTGKPIATTGDCVKHTSLFFKDDKLTAKFTKVTQELDHAIQQNNLSKIKKLITQNHKLLCQIGVVPEKIQKFITALEKLGFAAKTCGAGSTSGDDAGIVLIIGNGNDDLNALINEYNYQKLSATGTPNGVN